jgi:hypothetical protein
MRDWLDFSVLVYCKEDTGIYIVGCMQAHVLRITYLIPELDLFASVRRVGS